MKSLSSLYKGTTENDFAKSKQRRGFLDENFAVCCYILCGQSGTPVPTIYKLTTPYIQLKLNTTAKKQPFPTHLSSAFCTYGRSKPLPYASTLNSKLISAPLRHSLRSCHLSHKERLFIILCPELKLSALSISKYVFKVFEGYEGV